MPIPTTNLVLDLDADAVTPQTDDTDLTTWSDQSGEGNDVTQSTSANKPHYRTTRVNLNSKPTLAGDASNDAYTGGTALQFAGNSGLTIFAVVEQTETSGSANRTIIARDASGDRGYLLGIDNTTGKAIWIISDSATSRIRRDGDKVDCRWLPCLITARFDGTEDEMSIRINGVDDNGSIDGSVPATIGGDGPTLQVFNSGWSEPFGGRIARLLVYDAALSDADRDDAESTLMTEYDLSGFEEGSESPDTNSHQGYTTDGTFHYTVDTERIYKRNNDAGWTAAATNSSPFSGLAGTYVHLGDPAYYDGHLYIGCTQPPSIGKWQVSDLARVSMTDVSATADNNSAATVTIDPDAGIIYMAEFLASPGLTRILRYNLSDLSALSDLSITTETSIIETQGMTFHDGKLYVNTGDNTTAAESGLLFEVDASTGIAKPIWHVTRHSSTLIPEGMQAIEGGIRWLFDEGSSEKVYTYISSRLGTFVSGPFRNSNSIVEVFGDNNPNLRATKVSPEVLADANPKLRTTLTEAEVLYDTNPELRSTNTFVEVMLDRDPRLTLTQMHVEVVGKRTPPTPFEYLDQRVDMPFPVYVPVEYGERWGHS